MFDCRTCLCSPRAPDGQVWRPSYLGEPPTCWTPKKNPPNATYPQATLTTPTNHRTAHAADVALLAYVALAAALLISRTSSPPYRFSSVATTPCQKQQMEQQLGGSSTGAEHSVDDGEMRNKRLHGRPGERHWRGGRRRPELAEHAIGVKTNGKSGRRERCGRKKIQ